MAARPHLPLPARILLVVDLFLSVSALGGGGAILADTSGGVLHFPADWLSRLPFSSFFVPGLILFALFGVGSLALFVATLARSAWAPLGTAVVGFGQIIWIAVEGVLLGFGHPLQLIYLAVGVAMVALAGWWWFESSTARRRAWAAGS